MSQISKSYKVSKEEGERIKKLLSEKSWVEKVDPQEFVVWQMRSDEGVVTLYSSGKLVTQSKVDLDYLEGVFQKEKVDFESHIGVDEVGKGDYFGPLVVTAAYVEEKDTPLLKELGVGDSKKIADNKILDIYEELLSMIKQETVVISPAEYNELYPKYGNIAPMLADIHARAVQGLIDCGVKSEFVVIDQFSKNKGRIEKAFMDIDIRVEQFHKGESDLAVAMASVFARGRFLHEWIDMEGRYGMKIPKGASDVISFGKTFVQKNGVEELRKVAKVSFKTTQKISSFF